MIDNTPLSYPQESRYHNFFEYDRNVQQLLNHIAPEMLARNFERLREFGGFVAGEVDEAAEYSDRYAPPQLESYDKNGQPHSKVIFNSKYENCHRAVYARGVIGLAFQAAKPEPHLLSFTFGYLLSQADISVQCPVTMTGAVAYVIDKFAPQEVRDEYLPSLIRCDNQATSAGTWVTELHGGSDVAATTTTAIHQDGKITLHGLKWFTSNATSGLALATARPQNAPAGNKGLGLYLVPSHLKNGTANAYVIRRLKDKLGTKGLATGEIELQGAEAIEIAPPPQGLKIMMEALEYSRIHNAVGAAGIQRRALFEAACWATHRAAFGNYIIHYPMVQYELIKLIISCEASTALAFEAAHTFDLALHDVSHRIWLRIITALAKYRTADDAVFAAKRAIEIVGGNGYTSEYPTARLFRDAMVLPVWEGPANIQALELIRVIIGKEPGDQIYISKINTIIAAIPATMQIARYWLEQGLQQTITALSYLRTHPHESERCARMLMDTMADVVSGALLVDAAITDLQHDDARKALIATRYLEEKFAPRALNCDEKLDPMLVCFESLLLYKPINVATFSSYYQ